jgi:amino acid adenylation domain-containing protein
VVPIGKPIHNTRIYLLDPHGAPVPLGVTGELYIGGAGVARGYLNRPELTAERFIDSPFVAGDRLYRTGDLARYLPDGNIEYLGRTDHQVKIRGFRIELGEIEACLLRDPSLAQAVVIAREDRPGNRQLVAYVVPASGVAVDAVDVETLRQTLGQQLPDYMVPAAIVCLERLPLTPNGKLDRRELPVPDFAMSISRDPRTPQEEILAGLFAEVLGLERVGVDDSFFNLGGHSLLATRLISRIRSTLQVEIAIPTLFHAPTVAQLAQRLDGGGVARARLQALPRPSRVPLSFSQQRLWFLHQFEGASPTYNIPVALRLRGMVNKAALQAALLDVVVRHESLRTVFNEEHGDPYQRVIAADAVDLANRIALICQDVDATSLQAAIDAAAGYAFDICGELPIRANLFALGADESVLLLLVHHIASDGASLAPLARDLSLAYTARCLSQAPDWLPLPVQYADFSLWQRVLLGVESDAQSTVSRQIDYWKHALVGLPELISLPADFPRPVQASHRGAALELVIDAQRHAALVTLAREGHASLFMVLHAAVALLLSRLGAGADIVLGTPVAGRSDEALDDLIGFFVNILVLRTDVSGNPTFRDLLKRVCDTNLQAYAHQDLPFERLVDIVSPTRSTAHHPLFQVMLVLQNNAAAIHQLHDLEVSPQSLATQVSKFDLTFDFTPLHAADGAAQGLRLRLEYATDLFETATVERFASHLLQLFDGIAQHADQPVSTLDLLSADERTLLLDTWNQTALPYPQDRCLHQLFEEQVHKTPEATALVFDGNSLSYRELNARANRLAHHLIGLGVKPDQCVALCLDRSVNIIVGLLAILKAGGAYLPLDPAYPRQRLEQTLADAGVALLLTDTVGRKAIGDDAIAAITLIDLDPAASYAWDVCPDGNPDPEVLGLNSRHVAYVIYTSGSTGKPKGVMVEHAGAINLSQAQIALFNLSPLSRILQFASIGFDASIFDIVMAFGSGASLHLLNENDRHSASGFSNYLVDNGITHATLPPALLKGQVELESLSGLETLVLAGEEPPPAVIRGIAKKVRVFNAYGPTEDTIWTTAWLRPDDFNGNMVPIGKPIHNTRIYLLDPHGAPVPLGVTGELYIGGAGVARGYLNRPELTAERFIDSPFVAGDRLYRTGDLARYLPDGNIEYLGRTDHQVKIRGFRIELGEIEAVLCQQPGVRQAVVIDQQDGSGNKRLLAYLTAEAGEQLSVDSLRKSLRLRLPDYMIPAALVVLEHIPLSANGKVDRRALPEPDIQGQFQAHYVPPRTNTERVLAQIWSQILKLPQVGIEDNFFDLGGHSLLLMSVTQAIKVQLDRDMNIVSLFKFPTVAELAKQIDEKQVGESKVEERKNEHQQLVERISRQRSASVVRNRETREASALHASTNISTSTIIGDRHE